MDCPTCKREMAKDQGKASVNVSIRIDGGGYYRLQDQPRRKASFDQSVWNPEAYERYICRSCRNEILVGIGVSLLPRNVPGPYAHLPSY